mgnify:CR=1 FL=1
MRIILAFSLMAAVLVACGGGGGKLRTADVRVTKLKDTCVLSTEQWNLIWANRMIASWADYYQAGSPVRAKPPKPGIAIVGSLKDGTVIEIPECAYFAAIELIPGFQ